MKYDVGISNALILSGHNRYIPYTSSVGVVDGHIAHITPEGIDEADCQTWLDGRGKILMPGLVNAHCHGDMTLARGLGDDMTLAEQNERFADTDWFYTLIDDEDRFYSRQLTYCEALLSGTTFMMENMYWGLGVRSQQAMAQTGIRGALAEDIRKSFVNSDDLLEDEDIRAFMQASGESGLLPVMGSVSEEDFDTDRLQRINGIINRFGLMQTFHLAENDWRLRLVNEKYGQGSIQYLHGLGLLGEKVLGSHVVYLSDEEVGLLAATGTKVVNTPLCEMKIADGIAPIPEMVRRGVTVCLGTDGAMWNNSNDIFREMKGMALLHTINSGIRSLAVEDILDMATINGAKAFGLGSEYGTIEQGKKADFILLETRAPHMQPLRVGHRQNVASSVVYNATGRDVTDVFVDGRHVVKNRELQTVDAVAIMEKVQAASEKIADNI